MGHNLQDPFYALGLEFFKVSIDIHRIWDEIIPQQFA